MLESEVILQTQKTDFWGHNPQRKLFSICFLLPTPTDIKIRSVTGLERISRETSSNWSENAKIGPKQHSMLFPCQNRSEEKVGSSRLVRRHDDVVHFSELQNHSLGVTSSEWVVWIPRTRRSVTPFSSVQLHFSIPKSAKSLQ